MPKSTALLITCDPTLVQAVSKVIDSVKELNLKAVATVTEAYPQLHRADLVLLLAHLPRQTDTAEASGLVQTVAASLRPVPILLISDQHHPEQALALLQQGAADYLTRPLDLARLGYLLDVLTVRARYLATLAAPARKPVQVGKVGDQPPFFYDPSQAMGKLMELVHRVAPQPTTVLLTGETGTGKTRLARLIHDLSPRRGEPFLVVNCGALTASLIESELFGHVKGAFTGADRDRAGKFAEAGRGTLLLDEIDALPPILQTKLLRAVEERLFEPVGSNQPLPVQARLIVASNRALDQEVATGRFRSDLYYRLNVVAFHLPPLRERPSMIPTMITQFITEFATRNCREVHGIAPTALRALEDYPWPGNIRELRNTIERAVALCPGQEIQKDDLPETVCPAHAAQAGPAPGGPCADRQVGTLARTKEEAEALRISGALRKHKNNRLRVAAELGISRKTLYKKLHRYGLLGA
jgi:two-component system response regulator HydG